MVISHRNQSGMNKIKQKNTLLTINVACGECISGQPIAFKLI